MMDLLYLLCILYINLLDSRFYTRYLTYDGLASSIVVLTFLNLTRDVA